MITVAAVDYCERCKCKTLHVPMPSGERVCQWHLGERETSPPAPAPARERGERGRP